MKHSHEKPTKYQCNDYIEKGYLFDIELCVNTIIYEKIDNISFDNAILEKIDFTKCIVVPISCEWNDI